MVNRLFVAILYVLMLLPAHGLAQRAVGIDWEIPDEPAKASADLHYFSELGISHLQINQSLKPQTWQQIDRLEFTVWGMLPIEFAVTQTFTQADSSFFAEMHALARHYNDQPAVRSIGLYSIGAEYDDRFREAVASFKEVLQPDVSKTFYCVRVDPQQVTPSPVASSLLLSTSGRSSHTFSGYLYQPEVDKKWNPATVKSFISHTVNQPESPIFFNSIWLKEMTNRHPDFAGTLKLYATSPEPAFPLPNRMTTGIDSNTIMVVMLLLAWFSFGAIYSYNPVYRKSFMRYITGHRFFVDDVMERHLRDLFTGSVILLQHAIAGGIITYCLFNVLFSPLGRQALQSHYPLINAFGSNSFGIFIWGFLITLVTELLNIIWLWAINPATKYISQIINLYPWLLQINLIVATLAAAFFLAGQRSVFVYLLTALFLVLFICSFILTALDTVRFARKQRLWIYAGTIGIYSIIVLNIILWIAFSPELLNIAELAARLP